MRLTRVGFVLALPIALAICTGCTDVGDSSAGTTGADDATGDEIGTPEPGDEGLSEAAIETGAGEAGEAGETDDATTAPDTTVGVDDNGPIVGVNDNEPDAGEPGAAPDATVATETGAPSGIVDAGFDSTIAAESGLPDSGGQNGGGEASSSADSGSLDASADAAAGDGATPDTGAADSAGGGPTPCTVFPCAASGPNSVQCNGNNGDGSVNVCTPTEALYVAKDIAAGSLVDGQLDPNTSCYECLVNAGGLDDSTGDKNNECGDVSPSAPTLTGEPAEQACLDTLSCMINNQCDTDSPPSQCLCGTSAGTACLSAGAANGPCLQQEINGLDIGTGTTLGSLVEGDPTATQKAFTNQATPSGKANAIGAFAYQNCQSMCTP
jgi:hypothetical protein